MPKNKNVKRNAFLKCGLLVMAMVTMLFSASAQAPSPAPPQPKSSGQSTDPNRIYDVVEVLPKFPVGMSMREFSEFLSKNIKYPAADKEKNITGKVMTAFIVERDGSLSDIKVMRTPTDAMAQEAIRVLSLSPNWVPAQQNGKVVRARYTMPITFTLSK